MGGWCADKPCTVERYACVSLSVQGHNRYWSGQTPYATANGGPYKFLIDDQDNLMGHLAVPVEQAFWDFLMTSSKLWGLAVYEQVRGVQTAVRASHSAVAAIDNGALGPCRFRGNLPVPR